MNQQAALVPQNPLFRKTLNYPSDTMFLSVAYVIFWANPSAINPMSDIMESRDPSRAAPMPSINLFSDVRDPFRYDVEQGFRISEQLKRNFAVVDIL